MKPDATNNWNAQSLSYTDARTQAPPPNPHGDFTIKDSGERKEFSSGMVRDSGKKVRETRVLVGPMFKRWAAHVHKGAEKYPDVKAGVPNWALANSDEELQRAKDSAFTHMLQWLNGDTDEDHAAAVFFNVNLAEFVKEKLRAEKSS